MASLYRATYALPGLTTPVFARGFRQGVAALGPFKKDAFTDLDLPLPPKKPSTPYTLFFTDHIQKIKEKHRNSEGKIDVKTVAKETGAAWTELTAEEKKPYQDQSKSAQDAYRKAYKAYYEALNPSQLSDLNAQLPKPLSLPSDFAGQTIAQKKSNAAAAGGKPVRPLSSFFQFMAEFRKSDELKALMEKEGVPKAKTAIFTAKQGGIKWAGMSDAEKKAYADQTETAREAYKEWKATH